MEMILREVALPLRHPFTISQGTILVQENLIVELRQDGHCGYGEGASAPAYPAFTAPSMRAALEAARLQIEAAQWDEPTALWDQMLPHLGHNRFALCALDEAAHDLWGKRCGQPVYKLWGLSLDRLPNSDYTIGIDTIEIMVAKLREFDGWPIYKIKLGTADDLAIVRELRRHTGATFRVDANCAWSAEQTIRIAPELAALGVELIEQPLAAGDWDGMRAVRAASPLPIVADESCLVEADVRRCAGCFHGINIKLAKAGGLTPARRMIDEARQLGLLVMVGCMTESSVGISAIAQLLPLLDYVDMDGAVLIAEGADVARGVRLDHGRVVFPDRNGCGITFGS